MGAEGAEVGQGEPKVVRPRPSVAPPLPPREASYPCPFAPRSPARRTRCPRRRRAPAHAPAARPCPGGARRRRWHGRARARGATRWTGRGGTRARRARRAGPRNPIHEGGGIDFTRYTPTPHTHISTCGNVDLRLTIWV